MSTRAFSDGVLVGSFFLFPWPVTLILVALFVSFSPLPFEGLAILFLIDLVFSPFPEKLFFSLSFGATSLGLLLVLLASAVRRRINFSPVT